MEPEQIELSQREWDLGPQPVGVHCSGQGVLSLGLAGHRNCTVAKKVELVGPDRFGRNTLL